MSEWEPIETAPKDGTLILLLSKAYDEERPVYHDNGSMHYEMMHVPAIAALGKWNPEGSSWVDENGLIGCDRAHHLEVTGTWSSGGGWFQPDEVTHWMPLPEPPRG